ncbi:MAG: hypothetical protein OXU74_09420 [Gemmatimonadota bacterium]|nr:hypothetical protein [Gemmatimonadota bacterium]
MEITIPIDLTVLAYVDTSTVPECYIESTGDGELTVEHDPLEPKEYLSAAEVLNINYNSSEDLYRFISRCVQMYDTPQDLRPASVDVNVTLSSPYLSDAIDITIQQGVSTGQVEAEIVSALKPMVRDVVDIYHSRAGARVSRDELLSRLPQRSATIEEPEPQGLMKRLVGRITGRESRYLQKPSDESEMGGIT